MRRSVLLVLACLVGCGPIVSVDGDSEGDTGGSDGGATTGGGSTSSGVPQPTSVGTVGSDDGVPDPTIGLDVATPGECWQVQHLIEAPDYVRVRSSDQNGDGREEVWLEWNARGYGRGPTTVYALDDLGTQLVEYTVEAAIRDIADADGDTRQDLILRMYDDGPWRFEWARATGRPAFDDLDPLDLEYASTYEIVGFFDATLDGYVDGFRYDGSVLALLEGDGQGSFTAVSELAIEPRPLFAGVVPLEHNGAGLAVLQAGGIITPNGCSVQSYHVLRTSGGLLDLAFVSGSPQFGKLHAARVENDGTTVLHVDTCPSENSGDTHDARVLVLPPGSSEFTESVVAEGKRWVAVGDFDGDTRLDIAFADVDGDTVSIAYGVDAGTFEDPVSIEVPAGDVRKSNVRTLDMDGDGRDEILRGVAISDDGRQLLYERVFFGPC